ncbi:hypothetical protein A0H81_12852 [Grifola frondosa]|uniref:Uncharacterized protein n=1 Tax=Grifola frondosa TaxID=5627 RepID=A0A1C7LRA0_GRIFR|nr:hypothetical protein A0H81_12852 [Grifola frondosa]
MVSLVQRLKAQNPKIRIFGTFNVSALDYDFFRARADIDWSAFDGVYTSAALGTRMPHPLFLKTIFEDAAHGIDSYNAVFVGHDADDVVTARSFGMHGVLLQDFNKVRRELLNLVGDPVKRGWEYLRKNAGNLVSETDTGVSMMENFGQLLILEATEDRSLVSIQDPPRYWNFFQGKGILTHERLPDDLDTTSLGLIVTKPPKEHVNSLMDEMLEYLSDDGLPFTYFDRNLPRLDPVVSVNVLHLFYTHGRGSQLPGALAWVHNMLLNRAYLSGTRYYFAECFLYFTGRLLAASDDAYLHEQLEDLLRERLTELMGAPGDAIALAMRIVTCASLGISDDLDMRNLLPLQCEDGGWEIGWIYRYGISGMKVGSRGFTTTMAIKAIEALDDLKVRGANANGST